MTDKLRQCVKLLENAPEEFREEALKSLLVIVDDYEDWVSLGRPDMLRFQMMKVVRSPTMASPMFRQVLKDLLKRTE